MSNAASGASPRAASRRRAKIDQWPPRFVGAEVCGFGHPLDFVAMPALRGESCALVAAARNAWSDTCAVIRGTTSIMRHILPKRRSLIPSSFVVRALTAQGQRFACTNCGEQMFVRYESGLCPLCYNGRRPLLGIGAVREVPQALALAGVLDDPMLEELEDEPFVHERHAHSR
jgi:hypothetical protein